MIPRAQHDRMANAIRALAMDAVETAKSGHPGLPMGAADVATVLFTRFLHFDPGDPAWPDRDRFVLSAGHGSMLIYAVLHLLGVEAITIEEIKRFRQLGSITPGHPEHGHTPGIETTTGPLGQGLANAVGMAIAVEARDLLIKRGCSARVVSVPCFELFLASPAHVRQSVIGDAPLRIAVEAAVRHGWDAIIGSDGLFIGMAGFGASAPYKDLYRRFGITAQAVAEAALSKLIH